MRASVVEFTIFAAHSASRDTVLIRALYFAERQYGFEKIMKSFGSEDSGTANLAYGYCKLLLEVLQS